MVDTMCVSFTGRWGPPRDRPSPCRGPCPAGRQDYGAATAQRMPAASHRGNRPQTCLPVAIAGPCTTTNRDRFQTAYESLASRAPCPTGTLDAHSGIGVGTSSDDRSDFSLRLLVWPAVGCLAGIQGRLDLLCRLGGYPLAPGILLGLQEPQRGIPFGGTFVGPGPARDFLE